MLLLCGVPPAGCTENLHGLRTVARVCWASEQETTMNRLMAIIGDLTQWFRFHRVTDRAARRVLVVDDEAPMRQYMHTVLLAAGYDSVVACDGPDALATLEREGPFDVIVTDVMM